MLVKGRIVVKLRHVKEGESDIFTDNGQITPQLSSQTIASMKGRFALSEIELEVMCCY